MERATYALAWLIALYLFIFLLGKVEPRKIQLCYVNPFFLLLLLSPLISKISASHCIIDGAFRTIKRREFPPPPIERGAKKGRAPNGAVDGFLSCVDYHDTIR